MEITCYRDAELLREPRLLSAQIYNLMKTLLGRSHDHCVFLPIRSMQYLAIIDLTEVVFIDAEHKHLVDIAWQHFHAQGRAALDKPVAYEAVYYFAHSPALMARLQAAFHQALQAQAKKQQPTVPGKVIKLDLRRE